MKPFYIRLSDDQKRVAAMDVFVPLLFFIMAIIWIIILLLMVVLLVLLQILSLDVSLDDRLLLLQGYYFCFVVSVINAKFRLNVLY
jgi:hypothetical protein